MVGVGGLQEWPLRRGQELPSCQTETDSVSAKIYQLLPKSEAINDAAMPL